MLSQTNTHHSSVHPVTGWVYCSFGALLITGVFTAAQADTRTKVCRQNRAVCTCRDQGGDMEQGFTIRCSFKNSDLNKTYEFFRRNDKEDGKYLLAVMPRSNTERTFQDNHPIVEYHWKNKQALQITLNYTGGVTTHTFTQKGKDTVLTLHYSPD